MSQRNNVVNLRFERALLPKSGYRLSKHSTIYILKSGSKSDETIEFYTQQLIALKYVCKHLKLK